MSEIKYLLDEHVNPRLRKALKRLAPDIVVWRLGDPGAPPLSTLDPEILLWCENHGFSLVTNNRESMPVHLREHLAAGRHAPGIFTLNPNIRRAHIGADRGQSAGKSERTRIIERRGGSAEAHARA